MTEFVALRPKTYCYLMDDGNDDEKAKGTKKCVIKRILKFNDYRNCLFKNEIMLKSHKDLKVKHIMYILKKLTRLHQAVMMIKDCKLLIFDIITSYPYGARFGKVYKTELLEYKK